MGRRRQEPEQWETPHSATRRGRRGYFACRAMLVDIRSRRSATLPTTRGRADSCTLAKTDCGVARYSGRRSHIGLCQICACGASAFQGGRDGARPSRIQPFGRHAPRAARVLRVPGHVGGHPVAQERDQRRRGMNLPRHRRN